ncbi:MAG: hypothetical protein Q8P10_00505 [bacterium]|nr:hypothetical protein [bacterium]
MLTIEEFKKTLGETANKYTEAEIERLRNDMYNFAEIIYEKWDEDRNKSLASVKSEGDPQSKNL